MRTMLYGCCAGLLLIVALGAASSQRTQWDYATLDVSASRYVHKVAHTPGALPTIPIAGETTLTLTVSLPNNRAFRGKSWKELYSNLGGSDPNASGRVALLTVMGQQGFELVAVQGVGQGERSSHTRWYFKRQR